MKYNKTVSEPDQGAGQPSTRLQEAAEQRMFEQVALRNRMDQIDHKVMVLSGKGGVGKSTVAVNLAAALAMAGKRVGLLDVDIHGPSLPKLLNLEREEVTGSGRILYPVNVGYRTGMVSVMSIGFLLRERDDAVIWRGPKKYGMIKQFIRDVEWGRLDYLIVDAPPGTGDEPLAVAQLIDQPDGAVIVTTPQELAVQDVRRCVTFCRHLDLPILGVIENMSGFVCPKCGEALPIFGTGGGQNMSREMKTPFLGSLPIDAAVVQAGDSGTPIVQAHPDSEAAKRFRQIVQTMIESNSETVNETSVLELKG